MTPEQEIELRELLIAYADLTVSFEEYHAKEEDVDASRNAIINYVKQLTETKDSSCMIGIKACVDCGENTPEHGSVCDECLTDRLGD